MWRVVLTFAITVLIIYLSYLCSKHLGKGINRRDSSGYMKLIDQLLVGQDRYIAIVQIGDKYFLVGITAGQINVLDKLDREDLQPLKSNSEKGSMVVPEFRQLMEKLGEITHKER